MKGQKGKFRVFISYSSDERQFAEALSAHIRALGLEPVWARNLKPGEGFTPQIKSFIIHSHVFIPLLTRISSERGWVNQEIGYAEALNIPVLPVAVGCDPPGIISGVQAVRLDQGANRSGRKSDKQVMQSALSPGNLRKTLPRALIDSVVQTAGAEQGTLCRFVWHNEERIRLLGEYARMLAGLRDTQRRQPRDVMVRQKTGLTSFCTLDVSFDDVYWFLRYPPESHARQNECPNRSKLYIDGIRREGNELARLVHEAGCRLIIHPSQDYSRYGPTSKLVRLAGLISFLEDKHYRDVYVAISNEKPTGDSLTLAGDWFSATSVAISLGHGLRQTVFSLHAPSNLELVKSFDQEFEALLEGQGISLANSRSHALEELRICKSEEEEALGIRYPDAKLTKAKALSIMATLR